jgi:GR25 family glycosyltransferase involved in LPS biosynthesis
LPIFDTFDSIYVINLLERTDRRREMEAELDAIGLSHDPRVAFFPAIRPADPGDFTSVGARGVYEGQKQLLTDAAERGQSILILEDDCAFRRGTKDYVAQGQWDIFYGGYFAHQPEDLLNSDIEGAHMMGFSARGARLVAEYLKNLRYEGIHPPIDAAYVWFRREYPSVPTVFAVPPLARQRASRSDIAAPKPWDSIFLLRSASSALRQLRNRLAFGRH